MDRKKLRSLLLECFDNAELRTLCFDLGVDYDALPGDGKAEKARELVAYVSRRGELVELLQAVYDRRPNAFWEKMLRETAFDDTGRPTPILMSSGQTGPLREDYRALLGLSLQRIHERLDELYEQVGQVRVIAIVAAVLVAIIGLGLVAMAIVVVGG